MYKVLSVFFEHQPVANIACAVLADFLRGFSVLEVSAGRLRPLESMVGRLKKSPFPHPMTDVVCRYGANLVSIFAS